MSNATLLNVIATSHAINHAKNGEPWYCQCFACRFTKEYRLLLEDKEITVAEVIKQVLCEQINIKD